MRAIWYCKPLALSTLGSQLPESSRAAPLRSERDFSAKPPSTTTSSTTAENVSSSLRPTDMLLNQAIALSIPDRHSRLRAIVVEEATYRIITFRQALRRN